MSKKVPQPRTMAPRTAGFVGAGVALALFSIIVGLLPAVLTSYEVLSWLYALGLGEWLAESAWAGRFPDPLLNALGLSLLGAALLCFLAAALSALLGRKRRSDV